MSTRQGVKEDMRALMAEIPVRARGDLFKGIKVGSKAIDKIFLNYFKHIEDFQLLKSKKNSQWRLKEELSTLEAP